MELIAIFPRYKKTIKGEFFVTGLSSGLFIAAVFIFILSISIYFISVDLVEQKLKSANLHISTYAEGVLESLVISTRTNAEYREISEYTKGDTIAKENILKLFSATTEANKNIKFCYAGYENGDLLINGYIPPVNYDPTTRPWYTSAVESYPAFSVGLPYQEIKTGEWLISVSVALMDKQNNLTGVMAVDCTLEYVKALMAEVTYYESQSNFVVDSKGMIFVHDNLKYLNKNADEIVPGLSKLFTNESGFIEYDLNGIKRIGYYTKLKTSEWLVVSSINASEVMLPLTYKLIVIILCLILLAIIMGMGQVKFYERSFVIPITNLRNRIEEITTEKNVSSGHYEFSNIELSNISKRIEQMAETSLRKKASELKLILESTSDGIIVLDLNGNIIHTNTRFKTLWNLSQDIQQNIFERDSPLTTNEQLLMQQLNFENCQSSEEAITIYLEDGTILEQYTCPLKENDVITGQLWGYKDVTARIKAEEALKLLATTDSLTTLWNRRYFLEQGNYEIMLTRRTQMPISLLFIDIDFFKNINDTYGHSIGDMALKYLADILKHHVRSTDIVARLGGEEFCILAPNTTQESAFILAEKLRSICEQNQFMIDYFTLRFTLSIGVTCYDPQMDTKDLANANANVNIETLLIAADKACYQAKDLGRNRVVKKNL